MMVTRAGALAGVDAVVFDIGETLVDETRTWESWADWLGVPRLTLLGMIGWGVATGALPGEVVRIVRPGVDIRAEQAKRRDAGIPDAFTAADLYPDVVPCFQGLAAAGLRIGIAGNQPAHVEDFFHELPVELALCASSGTWRVSKPDPRFFECIAEALEEPPSRIAYVGDRVDNDVLPARALGMVAVHVRRGPWGYAHALRPDVDRAHLRIESLLDLLQDDLRSAASAASMPQMPWTPPPGGVDDEQM
jgi:FMN phosphatase YigB (HAD superfamily)